MGYISLKDLIGRAYEENSDKLICTEDIHSPDINEVFEKLDREAKYENKVIQLSDIKGGRKRGSFLKKVGVVTASIILISIVFSVLTTTPQVQAFKFNVMKTFIDVKENVIEIITTSSDLHEADVEIPNIESSDDGEVVAMFTSIEEARTKIGSSFLVPTKLPKGYEFERVDWERYTNDRHIILQIYKRGEDLLEIQQVTDSREKKHKTIIEDSGGVNVKEITVGDKNVILIDIDETFKTAKWYQDNSMYEISGRITESDIIDIIESLN